MIECWRIAYRNMWRNKRRTIIIILSISFALSSVIFMKGIGLGLYYKATESAVKSYTGYFQIQNVNYFEDKIIDNSFDASLIDTALFHHKHINAYSPRIEGYSLASTGMQTKGAMIVGIDGEKENQLTELGKRIIEGEMFSSVSDNEIIIGKELAKYLNVSLKDTVILLGQGYHGTTAAGQYTVKGIVHYPTAQELNKQIIYMPLLTCQDFFSAYGQVTSIAVNVTNQRLMEETHSYLSSMLSESKELTIIPWNLILSDFEKILKADMQSMNFIMVILYVIVGFSIFGTVLMMTVERRRELGIMYAIGVKKQRLRMILSFEMLSITLAGILVMAITTLPMAYYMHINPMSFPEAQAVRLAAYGYEPYMHMAWQSDYIINQVVIVLTIAVISCIYPIIKATNIKNIPASLRQ